MRQNIFITTGAHFYAFQYPQNHLFTADFIAVFGRYISPSQGDLSWLT
jgi:hypothetical protein